MKTSKQTKRALLGSFISLLLCFAMLIGSTFAWFTDTASTSVNKIEAGTLKVELGNYDSNNEWVDYEGKTLRFLVNGQVAEENTNIYWEPGCTYQLQPIRIKNAGSLALKYKVAVTATTEGNADLTEVLNVTLQDGTRAVQPLGKLNTLLANATVANDKKLAANSVTDELILTLKMDENAGNEYQGASISSIAVVVFATQDTVEYDSEDNLYDAGADYPTANLVTGDELNNAIGTEGASVMVVGENVELPELDKAGVTVSATSGSTLKTNATQITAANVTIKDATINGTGASGTTGTLNIAGDNTTIENVDYTGESGKLAITVSTGANNTGTVFKGTKITNAFRGIQFWNLSGNSVIEDCVLDISGYPFNVDAVTSGATLTVKNSTLNGWTSYTNGISMVSFDNCKFGKNAYAYLRTYSNTTLTSCEFTSADYQLNAGGSDSFTITLTNCTKNGTAITAANVVSLLLDTEDWNTNATLVVNGTTVTVTAT